MKKRESRLKILIGLFILLLMLTAGCKKTEAPSPQPAPKAEHKVQKTTPVQMQHSSAQNTVSVIPSADFASKKNPFKPFVVESKSVPIFQRSSGYGLLPIQNYEVGQFKVLGIITGLEDNSALVVDPAGKAYVIKPGMEMGKYGGQIEKITTTSIEIIEKYREENGKIKTRTIKLALPRKE